MSFLYPFFLFALLALAIPVIIHFFNFKRYKTVYFSNVQLLKLIKQDSKKKTQLKQILILIARLLAISALVFAFSRPYIPLNQKVTHAAQQVVVIYIDNSFSMKSEGEKGSLLEQAKQRAIEIANSYKVGTQFIILTSDFSPQHQFPLNKEQFVQQVAEIKESAHSPKLSNVYSRAIQLGSETQKKIEKNIFLLSDFQKNTSDFDAIKADSSVFTYLLPLKSSVTNNLLIDSCWFEVPGRKIGQSEILYVQISNRSDQAYQNIPIRLTINDSLKAISNISIAGQEKTILELNYTNNSEGIQLCKVELDDYPVIYDNSYFLSYLVRGKLNALGIYNPLENGSDYLKNLFAEDELISYADYPENNVQISQIKNSSCIFLINNQKFSSGLINELNSFVEEGGTLVIFPGRLANYNELNLLLTKLNNSTIASFDTATVGISKISYEHDLFKEVFKKHEDEADLPSIKGYTILNTQMQAKGSEVMSLRNGKSALTSSSLGKGTVYFFAFPISKANFNFIRHIIFVPTVYNMVLQSGVQQKYSYSIDSDEPILLNSSAPISELKTINQQTKDEFITSVRTIGAGKQQLILDELPKSAGHYLIRDGNQVIQSISYNYSRKESDTEFYADEELRKLMQSSNFKQFQLIESSEAGLSESLQDYSNGKQLWKLFIIIAILFMMCEMAIIRFWK
ncbi:MAG: BatA and WFA domain-containing protein [Prolixibacteraceae bacterium]|nr:BatA and WFA domain-containing protein [Prolixibacteraceae bacterium]